MAIFKRDKIWWIDYYAIDPRTGLSVRKREPGGSDRRQAQLLLNKRLAKKPKGHAVDSPGIENISFYDFAKLFLETVSSKKQSAFRDEFCIKQMRAFFGNTWLTSMTSLQVEKYQNARLKSVSRATVNKEIKCLRQMFRRAVAWGYALEDPTKGIKIFKEKERLRFISEEEFGRLLECAARHLRPILIMAWHTGLRKSNVLNLQWSQVHFKAGTIYIPETKSGERLTVPMNQVVMDTLKDLRRRNLSNLYVFCNKNGKPYGDVKKAFKAACEKAGIKDFRFHDLRHCFASHLVMKGASLNDVRELLGHKSTKMTLRYAHLSGQHKKDVVDLLSTHGHNCDHRHGHNVDTEGELG